MQPAEPAPASDSFERTMARAASDLLKQIQRGTHLPAPPGSEYVTVCGALCGADARSGPLKVCSACRVIHYCSPACQRADWRRHKGECVGRSKVRAVAAEGGVINFASIPPERARRLAPVAAAAP